MNEKKRNCLEKFSFSDPFMFSVPFETNYITADCQSILLMYVLMGARARECITRKKKSKKTCVRSHTGTVDRFFCLKKRERVCIGGWVFTFLCIHVCCNYSLDLLFFLLARRAPSPSLE
jgi:hypothetical protein